jgi:hypothetical protein
MTVSLFNLYETLLLKPVIFVSYTLGRADNHMPNVYIDLIEIDRRMMHHVNEKPAVNRFSDASAFCASVISSHSCIGPIISVTLSLFISRFSAISRRNMRIRTNAVN